MPTINKKYDYQMFQQDTRATVPVGTRRDFTNRDVAYLVTRYGYGRHMKQDYKAITAIKKSWNYYGVWNTTYLNPYQQAQVMNQKYFKALINIFGSLALLLSAFSISGVPILTVLIKPTHDNKIENGEYRDYQRLLSIKSEMLKQSGILNGSIENSQSTDRLTSAHIHLHGTAFGSKQKIQHILQKIAGEHWKVSVEHLNYSNSDIYISCTEAEQVFNGLQSAWLQLSNKKQRTKNMWQAIRYYSRNVSIRAVMKWISYCYKQYRFPIAYNKSTDPVHAKKTAQRWAKLTTRQTRRVLYAIKRSTYHKRLQSTVSVKRVAKALIINELLSINHELEMNGIVSQQSLSLGKVSTRPQSVGRHDRWASHHKHLTSVEQWRLAQRQALTLDIIVVPEDLIRTINTYSINNTPKLLNQAYIPTVKLSRSSGVPP